MKNIGTERGITIIAVILLLLSGTAYAISSVDQGFQAGWFIGDIANGTIGGLSVSSLISSLQGNDTADRTYVNATFLPIATYNGDFPNSTVSTKESTWDAKTTLTDVNDSALLGSTSQVTGLVSALAGKEPTITGSTNNVFWNGLKQWISLGIGNITGLQGLEDAQNTSISEKLPIATYNGDFPNSTISNTALLNTENVFGEYNQTFDTSTLFLDSLLNRIGIGTTSPETNLHIYNATENVRIRIETDKVDGIAALRYTNDARTYSTRINGNDQFQIRDVTADTERLTIDSSGNFIVNGIMSGNGSGLYSLNASNLTGTIPTYNSTYDATTTTVNTNLDNWNATYNSTYAGTTATVNANLANWNATYNASYETTSLNFIISNGTNAISTGIKGDVEIPFAGTIITARALGDQTGSINVSYWKDTYANFPPTAADLLGNIAIAAGTKAESTELSQAITAGDILRFNVESNDVITKATISLTIRRS